MVLKIPKVSVSTVFIIIPILYFNSCTFEFIKHLFFVLPMVAMCMLLWCIFLFKEKVTFNVQSILPMVVCLIILGAFFITGGQNRVSVLLTDFTNTIYLLFFMFVFAIYSDKRHKNDRTLILFVYLFDTVVSCIYSIYRLIEEPNLSRLLSTGSYHQTEAAIDARGIVSFGVVYGLTMVMLVLFFLAIHKKKSRIFNILLLILFTMVLLFAQFLIAICLIVIGILFILFVNNFNNSKRNLIRFFCIVVALVICILSLPILFKTIIDNNIFGYEINARLQEILLLLKGENLEGTDLSVRLSQYFISLSAFVSSYGLGKIAISFVDVGSHSQWLDGFGNYGLLFALYIFAFFMFRKFVIRLLPNRKAKQLYKIVFAIYIIMSLTNTSTWAPITLCLCVIVPFLCLDKVKE